MDEEEQILTELSSLDDLLLPLSRSARLKYNCMSVSSKFVALGSNTGGIYLFSRETCKLLQIVFAEKETSPVVMVTLSPNDKFVAMVVSSGHLHVIDLKVESRAKPETLRSTSDFWNATVTCLHWDYTSTRLYIGDSMGRVYFMPVHSSKAKNLFSLPLETIMKLDSSIVQIDKADDKLLVSTLARCYLCDTNRQQFSQIGKKSRDGQFGACFLHQGSSTPTIYCARPGSRIWEVDFDGNVMNTHQFKQLLAVSPLPVVRIKETLELPSKDGRHGAQSLNFPRLKVISGSYILTWTVSGIYVLDPVNVKVILWSQPFSEIQDVCCLNNEIFIFLPSMQVHCLALLPVSRVTALCLKSEAYTNAANLCIFFENSCCHKKRTEYFGLNDMKTLYDRLVDAELLDIAESLHLAILSTERKLAALSDSGSSGSGKSRTNSFVDKDSTEKHSNHKIEKDATSNHDIIYERNLEVDGILELNPSEVTDPNANTAIGGHRDLSLEMETKLTAATTATGVETNVEDMTQSKDKCKEMTNDMEGVSDINSKNKKESEFDKSSVHENNAEGNDRDISSFAINKPAEEKEIQNDRDCDTNYGEKVSVQMILSQSLTAQNTEQDSLIDTSPDNKTLCHSESSTKGTKEDILENGLSALEADKFDENKSDRINHVVDEYYDTGQMDSVNDKSGARCNINARGSIKSVFEANIVTEVVVAEQIEVVVETADDECHLQTDTVDLQPDNSILHSAETLDIAKQSQVRSLSPIPTATSLKPDESDDIFEDDLDLQSWSSNMGSRRPSLTSLSSLSSAEVYMEQVTGNFAGTDEIAVPVKRKSSKRKHRKSIEGAGDTKKKGVKINRSFSLGAIQTHNRKDFAASPQGSLDHTIEENCFTATTRQSGKSDHHTVSQSVPATTTVDGHARSLPNVGAFENNVQNVPDLPALVSEDPDCNKESVLSLSAEYSHSGDFGRSGEYSPSESPLLHSFEGTRGGTSASRKTALLHLKDRVQKNLKSQTKKVITNIKDKNLLTRAKVFLSQPIDHQKSEFFIQAHGYESHDTRQEGHFLDETDSRLQSPVDISTLQDITAETQKQLQDPSVLLNPDTVYKILLDWVTILNRTFHNLHLIKYAHSALSHSETVSDPVPSDTDQNVMNKISVNQSAVSSTEADETKQGIAETVEINVDKISEPDSAESKETETLSINQVQKPINTEKRDTFQIIESVKDDVPGTSILNDKDFCYTKDPLFLPSDVFSNVSELAQACFDIGCHGNILQYKNLNVKQIQDKLKVGIESFKVGDGTLSEVCDNSKDTQEAVTKSFHKVQGHSSEIAHHSKGQGCLDEKDNLCDNSTNKVCDTHSESANSLQTLQTSNSCSFDNGNISDKHMLHKMTLIADGSSDTLIAANIDKLQDLSADKVAEGSSQSVDQLNNEKDPNIATAGNIKGEGYHIKVNEELQSCDCNHGDTDKLSDEEMAFFVRCYFPYLHAIRIRNKTKEYGKCLYQTWCAFVCCLQELACDDSERYGVDNDALLQHMIESLSQGEDGYALLGHISKLFTVKSDNLVSACAHCHPHIQPVDVLFMCSLHGVALEMTFKSYMLQMIQDATRTHRKDTISFLYVHPEVKRAWLSILLSDEGNVQEIVDSNGKPCMMAHCHIWRNQPAIEDIVKKAVSTEDKHIVLELCSKFGYWNGCLRILKDLKDQEKQTDLILHLDDVRLFSTKNPLGYLPQSIDDWRQLLQAYKNYPNKITTGIIPYTDWSDRITWNSLAVLLVRHLGPSLAVSLLQEMDVPESCLTASFYQTSAMAGLVHRHQRLVLHSMLEKIDTYLWAQRPVYSSPQLHYIVVKEREFQSSNSRELQRSNSTQQEYLQRLIQQVKSNSDDPQTQYVEDPDCHWGVETKINLLCPCCNIPLKETMSHVEPGVLLFKCGHGYHRMCLPERDCFLCMDETSLVQDNSFV